MSVLYPHSLSVGVESPICRTHAFIRNIPRDLGAESVYYELRDFPQYEHLHGVFMIEIDDCSDKRIQGSAKSNTSS